MADGTPGYTIALETIGQAVAAPAGTRFEPKSTATNQQETTGEEWNHEKDLPCRHHPDERRRLLPKRVTLWSRRAPICAATVPGVNRDGNTDGVILHIVEGLVGVRRERRGQAAASPRASKRLGRWPDLYVQAARRREIPQWQRGRRPTTSCGTGTATSGRGHQVDLRRLISTAATTIKVYGRHGCRSDHGNDDARKAFGGLSRPDGASRMRLHRHDRPGVCRRGRQPSSSPSVPGRSSGPSGRRASMSVSPSSKPTSRLPTTASRTVWSAPSGRWSTASSSWSSPMHRR